MREERKLDMNGKMNQDQLVMITSHFTTHKAVILATTNNNKAFITQFLQQFDEEKISNSIDNKMQWNANFFLFPFEKNADLFVLFL